ncbi:MAG TPA: ABC transporter permease [Xanthobacteraceae bacterium]|nr:ABC transporter permease [Xanthobacteraceae bacterium]
MLAYVIRRVLATIPVMGVVALFVFSLLHLAPGDPAAIIAGDQATTEVVERIREQLGLNEPFLTQFGRWIFAVLHGDLGFSIFSNQPVSLMIFQRVEPTIALAVCAMLISIVVAVPMGVLAAWKAGTWIDRAVMAFAVAGFSFPTFVIGYLLILAFALWLNVLPVQGYTSISDGVLPFLESIILPSVTLGIVLIALIARMTRAAMLEVLSQDYIRTAQAKGLGNARVLLAHALKNASVPIVTTIGLAFALLISGAIVTETVFSIPGVGRLTVDAILQRDYPLIQGLVLVFSASYVLLNLLVDISYTFLDPRIRY